MMKGKKENCVELNVYVECGDCKKHGWEDTYPEYPCKKEEEETCVKINVFVECDKDKKPYTA